LIELLLVADLQEFERELVEFRFTERAIVGPARKFSLELVLTVLRGFVAHFERRAIEVMHMRSPVENSRTPRVRCGW